MRAAEPFVKPWVERDTLEVAVAIKNESGRDQTVSEPRPEDLPAGRDKPLVVGESGGSYYARPAQLAEFNGDRAFESYQGRNEALAIDFYDNIVKLARPKLAFFSGAETAWFGLGRPAITAEADKPHDLLLDGPPANKP